METSAMSTEEYEDNICLFGVDCRLKMRTGCNLFSVPSGIFWAHSEYCAVDFFSLWYLIVIQILMMKMQVMKLTFLKSNLSLVQKELSFSFFRITICFFFYFIIKILFE